MFNNNKSLFDQGTSLLGWGMIFYGLYTMFSGILGLFGWDRTSRENKKLIKTLDNLDYRP